MVKHRPRIIKPPPGQQRATDCLECVHGKPWKIGLVDCDKAVTAVENCTKRGIECVNFKNRLEK